jgi:hypothetical protein
LLVLNILRVNLSEIGGSLESFKFKGESAHDGIVEVEAQDSDLPVIKDQLSPIASVITNSLELLTISSDAVSPTSIGNMLASAGDEQIAGDANLYSHEADLTFTEDENKLETSIDDFVVQTNTSELDGREFTTLDSESFARALSNVNNDQNEVVVLGSSSVSSTTDLPGPRRDTNSASRNNRTSIAAVVAIENTEDINEHEQSDLFSGGVETDVLEASADFDIETSFTRCSFR